MKGNILMKSFLVKLSSVWICLDILWVTVIKGVKK